MKQHRKTEPIEASARSGSLNRNNVYTTDAVRDWAGRIHCGSGGIRMNEKYLLEVMAASCNPRGVCELPVRYLADHIGIGMRQAQRIIQKLIHYELVMADGVAPQGRPNDIVRKFILRTTIDPDTWEPKDGGVVPLMRHMRQTLTDRLRAAVTARKISEDDFFQLVQVHLVTVQSKRLDFVSPDVEVTNAAYRFKKVLLDIASTVTNSEVRTLHMIPKKGYRG